MKICIKFGGVVHCYPVPVIEFPVTFHPPGPGPVNYPVMIQDAVLLTSLEAAAHKVSDGGVRGALQHGIGAAMQAFQKRAGEFVTIGE